MSQLLLKKKVKGSKTKQRTKTVLFSLFAPITSVRLPLQEKGPGQHDPGQRPELSGPTGVRFTFVGVTHLVATEERTSDRVGGVSDRYDHTDDASRTESRTTKGCGELLTRVF